ncbi:MAG: polyisoprenoid-binding protein, partial [Azospirillum brasilense]
MEVLMRWTAYLPLFAMLAASTATAAPWAIDPARSTLSFTGTQAGDAFTGQFTKFSPVVEFDPAKPEAGHITVSVDMASARIDDKDKQESLPTEDWFFVEKFPTATFTSTKITQVGRDTNTYLAEGTLSLRGISQPVQLPFSLEMQD